MSRAERRHSLKQARKYLARMNARWPATLQEVPPEGWPDYENAKLVRVLRSRHFLVQVFEEGGDGSVLRMSVCRAAIKDDGNWDDELTWNELQWLKHEAGYGNQDAVELYPPDQDVVNVASMRHLWILPLPLPFGWRAQRAQKGNGSGE